MDGMHFAENLILTGIVTMMVVYGLVAAAATWAERPLVIWDERRRMWRSARIVQREEGRR